MISSEEIPSWLTDVSCPDVISKNALNLILDISRALNSCFGTLQKLDLPKTEGNLDLWEPNINLLITGIKYQHAKSGIKHKYVKH